MDDRIAMPGGTFAANLQTVRAARGYSHEELARRSGLDVAAVYRLTDGTNWPRLSSVLKLADALEVEPSELIQGLSARDLVKSRG